LKIAIRSFVAALALSASTAWAATPSPAQIDRLTDLVVQAMPFGAIFETLKTSDSKWPLGDKAGKATPEQLACLRNELSAVGYRRTKRVDVEAYAKAHPDKVEGDIRLLESGAAELFGKFVIAGAEGEASGKPADAEAIAASATPAQSLALTALAGDPEHGDLRHLLGMGNMFDQLGKGSDDEMEAEGEKQGTQVGVKLMLGAMDTCQLPMSALQ
jgi:hypothetical protein